MKRQANLTVLFSRPAAGAEYIVRDTPDPCFWRPEIGVFVVPKSNFARGQKGSKTNG